MTRAASLCAASFMPAVLVPAVLVALTACGSPAADAPVTVFAAASTTEVVDDIIAHIRATSPEANINATYGGSADLAAQINEGAPAAVFVSADEAQMTAVRDALDSAGPEVFATNHLTIVVPTGNPAQVNGLADLARAGVTSVVCAPQVPCGAATERLAALDGLTLKPASQENSVTDVLGKVSSGQADAGVVYVSDVARASGVEEVPIAGSDRVTNHYQVAVLNGDYDTAVAATFVSELRGEYGRAVLMEAGFGVPQSTGLTQSLGPAQSLGLAQ